MESHKINSNCLSTKDTRLSMYMMLPNTNVFHTVFSFSTAKVMHFTVNIASIMSSIEN